MFWGTMCLYDCLSLVRMNGNINSQKYGKVLENNLLNYAAENKGKNWIFLKDNASVHCSQFTKTLLLQKRVPLLSCLAKSTD